LEIVQNIPIKSRKELAFTYKVASMNPKSGSRLERVTHWSLILPNAVVIEDMSLKLEETVRARRVGDSSEVRGFFESTRGANIGRTP
jgi:hypothetical protein